MMKEFFAHRREKDGEPQSLHDHLLCVSELAGQFAAKIGLAETGKLIGMLHDVGKASEKFKSYIDSADGLIDPDSDEYIDVKEQKGKIDHSTAGAQYIYNILKEKGEEELYISEILPLCLVSHHSGLIDCLTPTGEDNFFRRLKKPDGKTRCNEAISNLDESEKKIINDLLEKIVATKQLTHKIKSLVEPIDSSKANPISFKRGLLVKFLFSCLIDADRIDTADFEILENKGKRNLDKNIEWKVLTERMEKQLCKFENKNEIDFIRSQISSQCLEFSTKKKGLFQLTVPTGGGKTLASLRFALNHAYNHNMDRIFYFIPFTSIIDQNAEVARKILEERDENGQYRGDIILEHHSNLTPEREIRRQHLVAENWDMPIVFTTNVQFLDTFYGGGTRSVRRMHQLANSIIIFDEVQTIPISCVHLFNLAIRFLVHSCNCTVVLCTATQPLLDKVEPKERSLEILPTQQMIPDVKNLFRELKRVQINDIQKVGGWSEEEVKQLAETELKKSNSVLIIVNTKASARSLFTLFTEQKIENVFHLSTYMCPAHRRKVLQHIKDNLNNEIPTLCISTQLIEAGVDIDFDTVIRYLAGFDSIVQAAGRCNRNKKNPIGNVFVINPKTESLKHLEDIRIGTEITSRILDEFKSNPQKFDDDLLSPKVMEQFYRYYFYDRKEVMNYPVKSNSSIGHEDNLFNVLSINTEPLQVYEKTFGHKPQIPLRQSFHSAAEAFKAINSPTHGVVVPFSEEGKNVINKLCSAKTKKELLYWAKQAQQFSVNVFPYEFEKLLKGNGIYEVQRNENLFQDVKGIFFSLPEHYHQHFGLSTEIVNDMDNFIISKEDK